MHRYALAFAFSLTIIACGDNIDSGSAPSVGNLAVTTGEDTPVMGVLDITADTGSLDITLGQPLHGTVTLSGATFTYTPEANYNGQDAFSVGVSDDGGDATAAVTITVTAINDAPLGVADSFATSEDAAHEADFTALLANDTDPDGDTLTISSVGNATNGTVAIAGTEVVFTPTIDFTGTGTYRYTLSDGTATADVTVTLTIGGVNDAPVAVDDTGTTDEDVALVVTAASLATNDTDSENQTLTVTAVTSGTGGTVALAGGDVTFTPTPNFAGAATYTYTVSDGALIDTGTVTVTVNPINDAPVAVDDAATTAEDTPVTVLQSAMIANDTDVDTGTTLAVTAVANAVGGSVTLTGGDATFTPALNFTGAASFEYTLSDGTLTDTGVVAITVGAANDPPVAVDDVQMTNEDVALVVASSTLVANDLDIDGDALSVSSVSNAANGTVALDAGGQITFTPTPNFNGTASFDYVVTDGTGFDTGTVTVSVAAVNDAPVANPDSASAETSLPATFQTSTFLANDTDLDGDSLAITAVSNASDGATVSLSGTTITFTSAIAFTGDATFDYTLSDGAGGTATGTVTVNVILVNVCGDGVVFGTETCDDDDTDPNDGCSATCQVETGYTCTGAPSVCVTTCGDGVVANIEACDDGDIDPNDGCDGSCAVEPGFSCAGSPSVCEAICGDGIVAGTEACDDNDLDPNDGCSATCTVETGFTCAGAPSTCTAICGDGFVRGAEACDDNDTDPNDGCDASCLVENGYTCTGQPSACVTTCGDGIAAGTEPCDDGDTDNNDGCTTQCVVGVSCATTAFADGDRFATDPDTGTCYVSFDTDTLTYAAAQNLCVAAGGYLATITSAAEQALVQSVQNAAQNPWIGGDDTAAEGTFQWVTGEPVTFTSFAAGQPDDDAGVGGGGDCLHLVNAAGEWNDTNCGLTSFVVGEICEFEVEPCGDGVLQPGEQCDDGNTANGDGCSATCEADTLFFSEYIEGTGTGNKAVEIRNPFSTPFDLATNTCVLRLYTNGSATVSQMVSLTGTIDPNDVFVVCHSTANAALLAVCNQMSNTVMNHNGDDAIDLTCGGVTLDVIGQIGFDPGTEWGTGLQSTADNTLRRKCEHRNGDTVGSDVFNPATEWDGFPIDTFGGFGVAECL